MTLLDKLISSLKRAEGWESKIYIDTTGHLTIGYGYNLGRLILPRGVTGKIVPVQSLPQVIGESLLVREALATISRLVEVFPPFEGLDPIRQEVLADMAYNLGTGILTPGARSSWPIFIGQIMRGDYEAAAKNMRGTLWYRQVGSRAVRLVEMMRTGRDPGPLRSPSTVHLRSYRRR